MENHPRHRDTGDAQTLKIATWNVNGIRARETQFLEWLDRDHPDVVCLQEIKAATAQVPTALCEMQGYWCYWHGERAYSGVGLHVRRDAFPEKPTFSHPAFDHENRIIAAELGNLTVASIYVPNGGKDFPAKMRRSGTIEQSCSSNGRQMPRLRAAATASCRVLQRDDQNAGDSGQAPWCRTGVRG